MRNIKSFMVMVALLALSACGQGQLVSRNAAVERPSVGAAPEEGKLVVVPVAYDVQAVNVTVPRTLNVSERNSFVPRADIVWHGDPLGDRYDQVHAMIAQAAATATVGMNAGPKVEVDIEITRFHALTPKARYTTGGNYATHFLLTVRDMATGEILDGPRAVVADTHATGGLRAMEEEAAGITQKVVIESHVAKVLMHELSQRVVPADEAASARMASAAGPMPQAVTRQAFLPADLGLAGAVAR